MTFLPLIASCIVWVHENAFELHRSSKKINKNKTKAFFGFFQKKKAGKNQFHSFSGSFQITQIELLDLLPIAAEHCIVLCNEIFISIQNTASEWEREGGERERERRNKNQYMKKLVKDRKILNAKTLSNFKAIKMRWNYK